MNISGLTNEGIILIIIFAVWELAWKAPALWRASKMDSKAWFAALLIINSFGILPMLYLLFTRQEEQKLHASTNS